MEDRRARRRPPLDADGVRAPTPSSGSSDRHAVHQLHDWFSRPAHAARTGMSGIAKERRY